MAADRHSDAPTRCGFHIVGSISESVVDIVVVPPVGAHPIQAWTSGPAQKPWLVSQLRHDIKNARVLLFDHGELSESDDLDSLGQNLLDQLQKERQGTLIPHGQFNRRPLFFICHSTGGLVAKVAIIKASRSKAVSSSSILTSCHGIAFLATPHQGSSYLSAADYAESIHHLMRLKYLIPQRLRECFRPRDHRLLYLSNKFRSVSLDMRIWTFLETVDSIIKVRDADTGNGVEFHVPVTSIRSGLLGLEHEKETPLATDHVGTASFKHQEASKLNFLSELVQAVEKAVSLSQKPDFPLDVKKDVLIQVNGFFESTSLGVSEESPLKLWSTKIPLREYLEKGAGHCLRARLQSTAIQPDLDDDSSLSSFEGIQTGIQESSTEESQSSTPARPQLKRMRSSLRQIKETFGRARRSTVTMPPVKSDSTPASPPIPEIRILETQRGVNAEGEGEGEDESSSGFMDHSSPRQSMASFSTSQSSKNQGYLPLPTPARGLPYEERGPRSAPGFDRPEPGSEKLLWIHVPYTHTGWVPKILAKASHWDHAKSSFFLSNEHWYSYHNRGRHLQPHARFVQPACIHHRKVTFREDPQLALYFPYLHWDTYLNMYRRRQVVQQRLKQGRTRPTPDKISRSSLEAKLIWSYLGSEPPIHLRRTLDQFGYSNLRSTVARDDDQMLWKRTRKPIRSDFQFETREPHVEQQDSFNSTHPFMDGKVLMVDQLWLWIVDKKTVVTFFPNQEASTSEEKLYEQINLHTSIYNELNGDLARRFDTAGDLAALIVLHAVTVLLDKSLQRDLQVLRIFEESISILTESITRSFKSFRGRSFVDHPVDPNENPGETAVATAERDERERREDLSALLELRDIIDELGTIMRLLDQQEATINEMVSYYGNKGYGYRFLEAALKRLREYHTQVAEMRTDSHSAQKAVENLLDLKQKQANVDEARMARWQAEVTQDQSRSVMVFTIFSVVFLPLSFFTSLFGINAREWSGTPQNLPLWEMFAIAAPTSIAIIVIALTMAFSQHLRDAVTTTHKIASGFSKEYISDPTRRFLRWDTFIKKLHSLIPEKSPLKIKIDKYLGSNGNYHPAEYDIWRRHEDKTTMDATSGLRGFRSLSPLPGRVREFENNKDDGSPLANGEKSEKNDYAERVRSRGLEMDLP